MPLKIREQSPGLRYVLEHSDVRVEVYVADQDSKLPHPDELSCPASTTDLPMTAPMNTASLSTICYKAATLNCPTWTKKTRRSSSILLAPPVSPRGSL